MDTGDKVAVMNIGETKSYSAKKHKNSTPKVEKLLPVDEYIIRPE